LAFLFKLEKFYVLFCVWNFMNVIYCMVHGACITGTCAQQWNKQTHKYCMQQSPSWEADRFSVSQKNSPHFMEPECSLPHSQVPSTCCYPEPARSSPYPHIPLLKIHLNIILPSTPGSSQWSLSFRFPTKTLYTLLLPPVRATWPTHLILLYFITRTIFGEQYRSLSSSLCSFLHSPVTSSLLDPNILLSTLSLRFSLNASDQVSHPYKKQTYL